MRKCVIENVWLAIGSNLGDPTKQVKAALMAIGSLPNTRLLVCSSYYRSLPLGPQDQPDFLNAVLLLETSLTPDKFLDYIQAIERCQGRKKHVYRFGPRTLDLDILLFGKRIITTPRLIVPHYDMYNREFVLYPLLEVAPNLIFPDGTLLIQRLSRISRKNLTYWVKE
ncbi:2-amino-4-hydroxy-6-hydroxymethyldihydropteridine pyrophosphokinase [secondary endosymbiont of Heteropsylla cubana]|uniref:2-amino-4-hydroxy-6-hydroxymethyldihydropteridine pyrophosphokinase n=1 Tax=secondary endosymbiont of Heteropsylla cubana TaxID=134287 RepID=J3YSP9_9ENTR|nr:2-amino-4-hydroxy-6-hydroxymethyldihydropteridine diphosphokinase [secondary endosymbiont of Heteropsylla cubana]AFP85333.1 2-amino-4-hydroxy-6-hydroxymethyldihydropteridine pyrophosphokinase [secondary endosymbiont of Heteropsylla cubana]